MTWRTIGEHILYDNPNQLGGFRRLAKAYAYRGGGDVTWLEVSCARVFVSGASRDFFRRFYLDVSAVFLFDDWLYVVGRCVDSSVVRGFVASVMVFL